MSTEVRTVSWTERLGSSFKGVIGGIILFIVGICVLFWNEGNYVDNKKAIEYAAENTICVPTNETIDGAMDKQLVHMSGTATTTDTLSDPEFGISVNAISLQRKVEYYQNVETQHTETRKKLGGGEEQHISYTYSQEWCSKPITEKFHNSAYNNPSPRVHYKDKAAQYAKNVQFGAFTLNDGQIRDIGNRKDLEASQFQVPAALNTQATQIEHYLYIPYQGLGYQQMIQPQAPAVPTTQAAALPVLMDGGFVTIQSIQNAPMHVTTINGLRHVVTPDGQLAKVTADGVPFNGSVHKITQEIAGSNAVYSSANQYATIPNYGNAPLLSIDNKQFIYTATGDFLPIIWGGNGPQVMMNGSLCNVTIQNGAQPQVVQPQAVQMGITPQVGDVRISWGIVEPNQDISIIAQQTGKTFAPLKVEGLNKMIDYLHMGKKSLPEMIESEEEMNTIITWLIRLGGWFAMFIGVGMVLKPLSVLADVIPFIGNIVGFGTGIIAFVVSTVVALVVIAIAWLFYRPLIAVPLLVGAVALIIWLKSRKKKEEPVAATDN